MWPRRSSDAAVGNLAVLLRIHTEAHCDDAEALARAFEDERIIDDGGASGRVDALLEATAHRWLSGRSFALDVPGLYEAKGFMDRGFRSGLRDPWPGSRDQVGHLLTALALATRPEIVRTKRFGVPVRSLAGAPRHLSDDEVALRLAIGHEKAPDPGRHDPFMLLKVRRQFRSASVSDVAAFRDAVDAAASETDVDLDALRERLRCIEVGAGTGNSSADLALTALGAVLGQKIARGCLATGRDVAAWLRRNVAETKGPGRSRG